jgi:NAD(P)-dependent dehydrogenase (short-subunit alcohol dehydrogenase family)
VVVTSGGAHLVLPKSSDYCISKHALGRFVEFIVAEYPRIKAFAVHPGVIDTELSRSNGLKLETPDTTELPAATMLYLTSGKVDWLSGK